MSINEIKRALVIGASGQVGGVIARRLVEDGVTTCGTYSSHKPDKSNFDLVHLDLLDAEEIRQVIEDTAPDCLYLAASYTDVDGCEKDPERSDAINVRGVRDLVSALGEKRCKVVYFSSDYVFDGIKGPYDEKARPAPVSVYGRHKLEAERVIASSGLSNVIVRTTVVYGDDWQHKNFVARLLSTLGKGETLSVPNDQIGNPTYNETLAQAAIELCNSYNQGVYNIAGLERVSRYHFALEAAKVFGLPEALIKPVTTSSLKQAANRPLAGGLILNKAKSALKTELIGYKDGLRKLKEQLPAQ